MEKLLQWDSNAITYGIRDIVGVLKIPPLE
jgi:hypothetical protein